MRNNKLKKLSIKGLNTEKIITFHERRLKQSSDSWCKTYGVNKSVLFVISKVGKK